MAVCLVGAAPLRPWMPSYRDKERQHSFSLEPIYGEASHDGHST